MSFEDRVAPAESVTIEVEDLGEPTPNPYADEAEAESAAGTPAESPLGLSHADIADRLVPLIRTPFSIAGLAISRRYPPGEWRTTTIELWAVSEAEARPIADALAPVIPAHWLVDRALAVSPWGAAGVQLYQLTAARLDGTAAIAKAWEDQHRGSPTPPTGSPVPDRAGSPSGNGSTPPDERAAVAPDGRLDGYEGAGLGI